MSVFLSGKDSLKNDDTDDDDTDDTGHLSVFVM